MTGSAGADKGPRPADLRLARLHLRLGSLELARAELEAFAGAGALDADALLDLAEVRWRTGDLAGAGVAAQAYLGEGGEAALALVIAAEASASMGRPTEARRLAAQAIERSEIPLERLFAGIPRSGVWPAEPAERAEPAGELFAIAPIRPPVQPGGGATSGASTARTPSGGSASLGDLPTAEELADLIAPAPAALGSAGLWDGAEPSPPLAPAPPPAPDPAGQLAEAREDLAAGRTGEGAARLAVALRLAPSLAPDVLDTVAAIPRSAFIDPARAGLELVRGDAYRLLGREVEARRSYAEAAAALEATAARQR